MDGKISITTGTIVRAVLTLLILWLAFVLKQLILVILTAVVIASAIEPAARWLKKLRIARLLAVLLVYIAVFAIFAGLAYFLVPQLLNDVSGVVSLIPGDFGVNIELLERIPVEQIIDQLKSAIKVTSGSLFNTLSFVFGGVASFVLIIVISFYLAVQENGIEDFLRFVAPSAHEDYVVDVWERVKRKIGLWIQGQLVLGLIVGVLVYLGLTILGIKYALAFAVMAVIFEVIPYFGPVLAAVPAVIVGFTQGITTGFLVLGLYIIIQQFENHLIYPLVVRKIVGVHPIIVILALVVGVQLAGFLGVILAVPASALLMEIFTDVDKKKHHLHTLPPVSS